METKLSSTPINSKRVLGRRQVRFSSLDEMLADAERLVAAPQVKLLGNWPLSQLLTHLAIAIDGSVDGITTRAPWLMRLVAPLIKRRVMNRGVPAGYKPPGAVQARLFPPAASPADALQRLKTAVDRVKHERMTAFHPIFGKIAHDEWVLFHLRHAELHLSFAVIE